MYKFLIIVLFIAVVLSLTSALVFLLKDMNVPNSKRALYALGIRIVLALCLMTLIGYGIQTGKIHNAAPWDNLPRTAPVPVPPR